MVFKKYLLFIILFLLEMKKNLFKAIQISTKCDGGGYYDPYTYECLSCPENMAPRNDGRLIIF
jgi:hypothetical protein